METVIISLSVVQILAVVGTAVGFVGCVYMFAPDFFKRRAKWN